MDPSTEYDAPSPMLFHLTRRERFALATLGLLIVLGFIGMAVL